MADDASLGRAPWWRTALLGVVGLVTGVPATQGAVYVGFQLFPGYGGLLSPILVVVAVGAVIARRSVTWRPLGIGLATGCLLFSAFIAVLVTRL